MDEGEKKADYSDKKKTTANNAVITINGNGVILGLSDYVPSSTHEITLMCDSSSSSSSSSDPSLITRCVVGESGVIIAHEYVDGGF